ncbi:MAG TPA: LppA family lipoprotein [Mycobacterium sp.]|nr:LppA family lipoprotein [Mycobacterium sp.]
MTSRRWRAAIAAVVAAMLSGCHYDPYPWPRPGQPSATPLESQLSQRDSLQDAANDLISVAAEMRDAVQRVYPQARWSAVTHGGQAGCDPPFTFLSGAVYQLPHYDTPAPSSPADREAVIAAAADVLRAHHAEKIDVTKGQSVSGQLPRDHGNPRLTIGTPTTPVPPLMTVEGQTGCHHAAPGPGPWDSPPTPTP